MYTIYMFNILVALLLMGIGGLICWPIATQNERLHWYESYFEQDDNCEDEEAE